MEAARLPMLSFEPKGSSEKTEFASSLPSVSGQTIIHEAFCSVLISVDTTSTVKGNVAGLA